MKEGAELLSVTVLAVGRLRETYLSEAVAEYEKRLAAFCKFRVIELAEARLAANPSEAEIAQALSREGEAILARVPPRSRMLALCVEGKAISSEGLAETIGRLSGEASQLVFVIGSSHGLAPEVKEAAQLRLSLSAMTFPHQLARVMLCEQIYRAFSIGSGGKYHK